MLHFAVKKTTQHYRKTYWYTVHSGLCRRISGTFWMLRWLLAAIANAGARIMVHIKVRSIKAYVWSLSFLFSVKVLVNLNSWKWKVCIVCLWGLLLSIQCQVLGNDRHYELCLLFSAKIVVHLNPAGAQRPPGPTTSSVHSYVRLSFRESGEKGVGVHLNVWWLWW